jgi:hypothetical protein
MRQFSWTPYGGGSSVREGLVSFGFWHGNQGVELRSANN